jgi:1-acyl-sn-glycerol-3-phosphate acyltransferase
MGLDNIEKKNLWYTILLKIFVKPFHNKVYYRKVHVNFKERIPVSEPVIITSNHQNALMDALALLCNIDKQLVFVARSDIFKNKSVARLLHFFKILPIFRIRDGYSSLKNNDLIFQKTIDVLRGHNALVIFPEGNHILQHALRPLKKGFARIAFNAEKEFDYSLNIKILPVGLHYSSYDKVKSDLIINIGHPISVSAYYDQYKKNQALAINQLTSDLSRQLKDLVVNNTGAEHYEMIESLSNAYADNYYQNNYKTHEEDYFLFRSKQEITNTLLNEKENNKERFSKLAKYFSDFQHALIKSGVKSRSQDKDKVSVFCSFLLLLRVLIGLPFFVYGSIFSSIPWLIIRYMLNRLQDKSFYSSFNFVLSLVLYPFFYIIQTIIFYLMSGRLDWTLLFALSLSFTGVFLWKWFYDYKRLLSIVSLKLFKISQKKSYNLITESRLKLDMIMHQLLNF